MRILPTIALATLSLLILSTTLRADDTASLLLNNAPAKPGDYKCDDIHSLVMSNSLLSITFGKDALGDFSATSLTKNGQELVHNLHGVEPRDVDHARTFYFDYGASSGRLSATRIKIVSVSPDMVHFAVIDDGGTGPFGYKDKPAPEAAPARPEQPLPSDAAAPVAPTRQRGGAGGRANRPRLALENHFIMRKGQSGIYSYAIVNTPNAGGEMRTMYRFDRDLLDHAWTVEHVGIQPKYSDLDKMPKLQDETWRLPDGSVYQKYDYVAYYAESPMWGHFGHGFGAFFIPVSNEYYAGGPFREELIVHQDALILNYLGGGHFGGGGSATNGKPKMFGPWFIYINAAPTQDALIADALATAKTEQAKWPYQWVNEPLYPTKRTTVTGQLHLANPAEGQTAAHAWVCLAKPGTEVYKQGGDFIFYTKADDNGHFSLPNVRPGSYALYAWPREGSIVDELEKDNITISNDSPTLDLGSVDWKTTHHNHLLWQIGKSDAMAGEFKFGDQIRNVQWIEKVPANLNYTIGQSKESQDWYFAQAKVGHWDIHFNLTTPPTGNAYLTIALAGGGGGPIMQPEINGTKIGNPINPANDASTYRSAIRSAQYNAFPLTFPANLLKPGQNTLTLNMTATSHWKGLMYDTIILESD